MSLLETLGHDILPSDIIILLDNIIALLRSTEQSDEGIQYVIDRLEEEKNNI